MKAVLPPFRRNEDGTTAVEFAIVGPLILALMFWFFDLAFSLYARNSFMHAVNEAAREVYLDPDRTDEQLEASLTAKLHRFSEKVTVESTLDTSGALHFHVINAQMTYHFKTPPFSATGLVLTAESRAPVIDYKLPDGETVVQ